MQPTCDEHRSGDSGRSTLVSQTVQVPYVTEPALIPSLLRFRMVLRA
jgi:hypothetical protein